MGLDITAYRRIKYILTMDGNTWDEVTPSGIQQFYLYANYVTSPDFPEQICGAELVPGGVYEYAERYDFRAGSYSGYNAWRDQLARTMIGVSAHMVFSKKDKYRASPFYLLINFSDCEGVIAGPACMKLANDFASHQEQVDQIEDEYFRRMYGRWRTAFELAADGGLVKFH